MLETRPLWIVVLALNVCIFIWLIAVEEPVMLNVSTTLININNNYNNMKANNYKNSNNNNNSNISSHVNFYHYDKFHKNNIDMDSIVITKTKMNNTLPHNDYSKLIDLLDYRDLMTQTQCTFNVKGVILVHSAPRNHEKRQIIRDTWGKLIQSKIKSNNHSRSNDQVALRLLFLLGAVKSFNLQDMLQFENAIYGDLIQGSFIDDYRNMTYKHVMAFKWFLYNCPNAQILIKVDDDVYVNTIQLMDYIKLSQNNLERNNNKNGLKMYETNVSIMSSSTTIQDDTNKIDQILTDMNNNSNNLNELSSYQLSSSSLANIKASVPNEFDAKLKLFQKPKNLLFCKPTTNALVKRSHRSKWRVSYREFNERYYPKYCPGYAIIYSADVVLRLYIEAQKTKYFWIDDVHITGILAEKANISITTSSHYELSMDKFKQLLSNDIDIHKQEFLFAWHSISAQQIYQLWSMQMLKYNMTMTNTGNNLRRYIKHNVMTDNNNVNTTINTNTIISTLPFS